MGLDLLIVTSKGHIKEVTVISQLTKGNTDVALKIISEKTKLFASHLATRIFFVKILLPPIFACLEGQWLWCQNAKACWVIL